MSTLRDAGPITLAARRARRVVAGARRLARWAIEPDAFAAPSIAAEVPATIVWRRRIAIARPGGVGIDARLEAGKRRNLALAAPAFDGLAICAARPLSFWRALGPATAARGFAAGVEIAGGCVVPAIGGGLCLLSNSLFAMAAELGWHILERHGHSMALADPDALDATVAWPHVDLRIAPRGDATFVIGVAIDRDADALVITARGPRDRAIVELDARHAAIDDTIDVTIRRRVRVDGAVIEDRVLVADRKRVPRELRTCLDCGETACRARRSL